MPNCGSHSMRSTNCIALEEASKRDSSGTTGSRPSIAPHRATARESVADALNVSTKMPDTTGIQMRKLRTDGRCISLVLIRRKARLARNGVLAGKAR
jgi:hypothetical protein